MDATPNIDDKSRQENCADMLRFMSDFSRLMDNHIQTVRLTVRSTVEDVMKGVVAINVAADETFLKSKQFLALDSASADFTPKSITEIDPSFKDPVSQMRLINETLADHMARVSALEERLRASLYAIIGSLSVDDVVRQRLENVSKAMFAMRQGVERVLLRYSEGNQISDEFFESVQDDMLRMMYDAFIMEDEKAVFASVFGEISGINQKSS